MDFLYKIENFLNALILRCGEKLLGLVPLKIRVFFSTIGARWSALVAFVKNFPAFLKSQIPVVKEKLRAFDLKARVIVPLKEAAAKVNGNKKAQAGKMRAIAATPFLLLAHWMQGLSAGQSLLLIFFTCASFLSGISIISSGSRLMHGNEPARAPASAEVSYDRPAYYKKDTKHVTVTNLRLPVYIPEVNQLRSVDIDFTATMTTRESKQFLEKAEFQLRDHLILEMEPSVASFPLTEEGKEIIRTKIQSEIEVFLREQKVNGYVEDLKVVYILAN